MNVKAILKSARRQLPSILSGVAVLGVGFTGYFTHRAAAKLDPDKPLKKQWKNYILPVMTGAGTIACIIISNRMHLGIESNLAAAVTFYKLAGEEFEDAVFDKFSDAGLRENVVDSSKPESSDNIKLRIWEPYTKQYFEASQREVIWAELTANKMLQQKGEVTLNDILKLYSDRNIKFKKIGDELGWSYDSELFNDSANYYYAGGWIDMCPQFDDYNGCPRFVLDYGINPIDLTDEMDSISHSFINDLLPFTK